MQPSLLPSLVPIKAAARYLKVTAGHLLSLCADARVHAFAPVLNYGVYQWPNDIASVAFPELQGPLRRDFGPVDRVQLTTSSLKEIEGQGWSDVREFFAIEEARVAVRSAEFPLTLRESRLHLRTAPGLGKASYTVETLLNEKEYKAVEPELSDLAFATRWIPVKKARTFRNLTTVRHLFFSKRQLDSLLEQLEPAYHGNTERYAAKREQIFAVALNLINRDCDNGLNASELAQKIETASHKFWPETCEPPMALRSIEGLLQTAISTGKIRGR